MDQSKRELQVGVTVLVSVLVFVAGFMWFEQVRLTGGADTYYAEFPQVAGLQIGDRVQVRGIRMGTVTDFAIVDDIVRVEFQIEQGASLREDAQVKLGTKGIVGEVLIDIDPGMGAVVPSGHVFAGKPATSLEVVTESFGDALRDVKDLTGELREFMTQVRTEGKIVETLADARDAVADFGDLVAENRADIRALLAEATAGVADLRTLLADSSLSRAVDGMATTATRADTLLARVATTSARLDSLAALVERGEGTVGRLFRDESLYVSADSTLTSLNRLLRELRRHPKKYFKLSVLDF